MSLQVKAKILNDINRKIKEKEEEIRVLKERRDEILAAQDNFINLSMKLKDVPEFSNRRGVVWGLERVGIITVEDLINSSPKIVLKARNVGMGRLQEIEEWMQKYHLKFKD